jgi:hypothetical protein
MMGNWDLNLDNLINFISLIRSGLRNADYTTILLNCVGWVEEQNPRTS